MTHVALLRGINVGGKNKVEMARLKAVFESIGFTGVRTYINSGNVVFESKLRLDKARSSIEKAIAEEFGFPVRVVVLAGDSLVEIAEAIPSTWTDDRAQRCYVMFLWEEVDEPGVLDKLRIKEGIDDVRYVPGAVIWRVDRDKLTRSGMMRLPNDALYREMTMRNSNTVRKLAALMTED